MDDEINTPCMNMYGFPIMKTKQDCIDLLEMVFGKSGDYEIEGSPESCSLTFRQWWRGGAVRSHVAINWSCIYRVIDEIVCDYVHVVCGGSPSPYTVESSEGGKDLGIAFSQ